MKKSSIAKITGMTLGCMLSLGLSSSAFASDWLSLQGTEPEGSAQPVKVWGFVQAQYQSDQSDPSAVGNFVPAKLIGPNLDSQSAFNVNRARLGARGVAMPLDSKINYFLLVEFGNNGITAPGDSFAKLTDASLTFNHIDAARIRAGLFKTPGAEEGLQAIHVFDYINFTNVTNQMLLERYPNRSYTPNTGPQVIPSENGLNGFNDGVGAFRDVGVQVFNTFKRNNNWEFSYAGMVGNGNGLNFSDNDDNKDLYGYLAAEKVYAGAGARRQGLKMFAWTQQGKRTADLTADTCINSAQTFPACGPAGSGRISTVHNPAEYDRDRSGVGVKYSRNGLRLSGEYMKGEGMIFQGPHNQSWGIGPGIGNPLSPAGNGANAEASGYYLDAGYRIKGTPWELDLRYDIYDRLEGNTFEANFEKTTLGAQYFFNPRVRIAFNYEISDANAPNFGAGAGPNANLDGISDRFSVQVTGIFSQ